MRRILVISTVLLAFAAACGDDATSPALTITTTPVTTSPVVTSPVTTSPVVTSPVTTSPVVTSPVTTTPVTTSPVTTSPVTTSPIVEPVIAVWPAPDVVFETPEEAAADFITQVFRVEPFLGPFQAGDSRSGEIEVLTPLDDADPTTTAPAGVVLLLRQLGPDDGWFVIGTLGDGVTIDEPEGRATVPAEVIDVTGTGRGFEATLVVTAIVPGGPDDPPTQLDQQIVMTDWQTSVPFATTLDLSGAEPGDVIAIVARGDTGIEATGEFAAIPVVVG